MACIAKCHFDHKMDKKGELSGEDKKEVSKSLTKEIVRIKHEEFRLRNYRDPEVSISPVIDD